MGWELVMLLHMRNAMLDLLLFLHVLQMHCDIDMLVRIMLSV